ncbi:hypothetical protein, variant [Saprolegnia diclina VS20]|uniref:tRNA threonylcarbamoyladenosine biosynthesis protein TsaE n=1 Tax=Saprolegnia diclina (strain VS20) TaxID=1156394 RepID=T0Q4B2_SAPDV|nr:hypothetical protein, variant [Saprolegnia diclina VS20]EQC32674.1 hypothetical protein, variant [Saprolegnia diclina VS20]|eukprot:XP_008613817.1 hypothetical protein, variant [Saprolegnia diclina VS20]
MFALGRRRATACGRRWLHAPALKLSSPEAMEAFGAGLAPHVPCPSTVFLVGDLGCGKTCFARGFVRAWTDDADMHVTSPTYLLLNTYDDAAMARSLYHMDLYRLDSVSPVDAKALGLEDAFASSVNLIEWPDRLTPDLVPGDRLEVHIAYTDTEDERAVQLKAFGSTWESALRWFESTQVQR